VFKLHMFMGMTLFAIFPFSRLVHVWSGFASIGYVMRPYQVVRSRRMNLPRRVPTAEAQRAPQYTPTAGAHPVPKAVAGRVDLGR